MDQKNNFLEIKIMKGNHPITLEKIDQIKNEFCFEETVFESEAKIYAKTKGVRKSPLADLIIKVTDNDLHRLILLGPLLKDRLDAC